MDFVNRIVTSVFDLLLWPFSSIAPIWGLLFVSVLSGVVLLLIYGRVSNQNGIRNTKRKIASCLLEAVLYRHDLRTSLRAQAKMLGHACMYFAYAVPPILILMVPCILILAQLNLRYNSLGIPAGERGLLRVQLDKPNFIDAVTLTAADGMDVTPRLRIAETNEILWRISPTDGASKQVALQVEGTAEEHAQTIFVKADTARKIPAHRYKSWWWGLLYPGRQLLPPDSPLAAISFSYPETRYRTLGITMHWLVVFLLLSIISGVAASRIFRVEI